MKDQASKRIGIWIRVSTADQAAGESPEHHERRARMYAESRDWSIVEVYHLEGVSGKSVREHPETERMLKDIASGHITGLIFSKLARLARNTKELLEFADQFREHGADLVSLQEAIDTSTPAGRLFYTMIAAMAQWEREEIAERVAASIPIRAKLGRPLSGSVPYGYRRENRKLVPDPDEAPIRRLAYELFHEHRRKKTVARLLNARGYRTRSGRGFSDTTVERILRDPTAKGRYRANYTRRDGRGPALKPQEEWVWSDVEPIVSEELWGECNAILDERKNRARPLGKKPRHLFAGFAFCTCGEKMYVPSNSPKYICHACRNKIPVEDLEAVYHEQLKRFLFSPEEVAACLEQGDQMIREKVELLEALNRERAALGEEMEKVYRLYLADKISADGFGLKFRPKEERQKQLDEQLPALQGEIDFLKVQRLSSTEIVAQAQDLHGRWPELAGEDKRTIVEAITERITVGSDEIRIDLCYLPASSDIMTKRQLSARARSAPRPTRSSRGARCSLCPAPCTRRSPSAATA